MSSFNSDTSVAVISKEAIAAEEAKLLGDIYLSPFLVVNFQTVPATAPVLVHFPGQLAVFVRPAGSDPFPEDRNLWLLELLSRGERGALEDAIALRRPRTEYGLPWLRGDDALSRRPVRTRVAFGGAGEEAAACDPQQPLSSRTLEAIGEIRRLFEARRFRVSVCEADFEARLAAAKRIHRHGGTEAQTIAALLLELHDLGLEDEDDASDRALAEKLGADVLAVLEGAHGRYEPAEGRWLDRREGFLDHLVTAPTEAVPVVLARACAVMDQLAAELEVHGGCTWGRCGGGRHGTLWYYSRLIRLGATRLSGPLVTTLFKSWHHLLAVDRALEASRAAVRLRAA